MTTIKPAYLDVPPAIPPVMVPEEDEWDEPWLDDQGPPMFLEDEEDGKGS